MASNKIKPDFTCPEGASAALLLSNGEIFWGKGIGAETTGLGELCFNTSLTGYQEILTDPSYAGQIICFTFPHIGNVGANPEDLEAVNTAARGLVIRADITEPSNFRASEHLNAWLQKINLPGICGLDTREITRKVRSLAAPSSVVIHNQDASKLQENLSKAWDELQEWQGLSGLDLAIEVTTKQSYQWDQTRWNLGDGFGQQDKPRFNVVAFDFGAKQNILRCLASAGCNVTVVPANTSAEDVLAKKPDGVFLSNGPGDPEATGVYAVETVEKLLESKTPIFGICLGHQILARALGAKTVKMTQGHRGGNHPVKDLETNKVEITSQNHGFCVDEASLPDDVIITHRSLFDGTNEGIKSTRFDAYSVQYHPEASPGPEDSLYLFERFTEMMNANGKAA
ncbi:MAG: glutamine-hydrolyzing carbamoyl-phosphate synthase small subunit [Alphaproteobacteria bacterium]